MFNRMSQNPILIKGSAPLCIESYDRGGMYRVRAEVGLRLPALKPELWNSTA